MVKVTVLGKVPLLKDLDKPQLARAAEVSRTVEFKENDVVINKGELGKEGGSGLARQEDE